MIFFHVQRMPVKDHDESVSDVERDEDDDIETAGAWAQGLAKGVFAHKRSASNKRKLKSPKKSRYN